jgi:hypothetical protein
MRFTNALFTMLSSLILSTSSVVSYDLDVTPVEYVDTNNGQDLPMLGYISIPKSVIDDDSRKVPAVVILPVSLRKKRTSPLSNKQSFFPSSYTLPLNFHH